MAQLEAIKMENPIVMQQLADLEHFLSDEHVPLGDSKGEKQMEEKQQKIVVDNIESIPKHWVIIALNSETLETACKILNKLPKDSFLPTKIQLLSRGLRDHPSITISSQITWINIDQDIQKEQLQLLYARETVSPYECANAATGWILRAIALALNANRDGKETAEDIFILHVRRHDSYSSWIERAVGRPRPAPVKRPEMGQLKTLIELGHVIPYDTSRNIYTAVTGSYRLPQEKLQTITHLSPRFTAHIQEQGCLVLSKNTIKKIETMTLNILAMLAVPRSPETFDGFLDHLDAIAFVSDFFSL